MSDADMLPSPLLVITDRHRAAEPLTTVITRATQGDARWIRVREPDLGLVEYVSLCHLLIEAVASTRVTWSVRPHAYAMLRTAHPQLRVAVHVTERDAPWAAGDESVLVGRSVHTDSREDMGAAVHNDYSLLSPVFDTECKPEAQPLGVLAVSAYVQRSKHPVVALGGVTVARAAACRGAGASAIAVCGGIMGAADPEEQARAYLDAWGA